MNSQDTSSQIQAIEAAIEKLVAKPAVAGDGTASVLAAQMMQKENLQKDLQQQLTLNQDQMIKNQMEQARLRSEIAYKEQVQQARALQEQTQREREAQAKLRQEQINRYEQQQTKLKQEQAQREQLEQANRRQEQLQREREQQARLKQEQMQREQQLQARLKQEQIQREKARQEQLQKDRAQQEKARLEQIQKDQRDLLLAQRLKEERNRIEQLKNKNQSKDAGTGDKKPGKNVPRTPEQLAKDEAARAFSARTEMSLTSIAFCSPLMLFGMGAAMSIFDNFAGGKRNPALLEARRKSQQQMELSEYARVEADKKFNEMVERNNLTNKSSVTDVNATKFGQPMKGVEKKEEKPRVNRFVAAEAPPMPASRKNDSLEVKKLWKERQRLLEHLERVRGQGSLALVSKLVSQLETLDRSLKRLGCDPQA